MNTGRQVSPPENSGSNLVSLNSEDQIIVKEYLAQIESSTDELEGINRYAETDQYIELAEKASKLRAPAQYAFLGGVAFSTGALSTSVVFGAGVAITALSGPIGFFTGALIGSLIWKNRTSFFTLENEGIKAEEFIQNGEKTVKKAQETVRNELLQLKSELELINNLPEGEIKDKLLTEFEETRLNNIRESADKSSKITGKYLDGLNDYFKLQESTKAQQYTTVDVEPKNSTS